MTFPRSLSTKEMAEYVVRYFAWDRRGAAFPSPPLSKDFQALCPSYELAVAKEAVENFNSQSCPRRALRTLESALTELRRSTFESWLYDDWIFETRFRTKAAPEESSEVGPQEEGSEVEPEGESSASEGRLPLLTMTNKGGSSTTGEEGGQRMICTLISPFSMAFSPLYSTREMVDYVMERATHPPCPLPEDYNVLCPHFSLPEVEGAAVDFELSEMVQAIFYVILLNEAIELSVVHGFMAEGLKSALVGLRWLSFEAWMSYVDNE
ncbi:LOW QUALITY PROTEIN: hypothetical protein Cgig2_002137 [Carnegiea gigantea]|uniref:Uncharacterized protein n=1 Tax=Carnegiea gigantea TaxID=171969 RepID=A0A9Q1KXM6_9CARY|nr:LOW QUALITY PROTEIN: hypothetical protein Cgig2_002137 [Carnegiea gigantea]